MTWGNDQTTAHSKSMKKHTLSRVLLYIFFLMLYLPNFGETCKFSQKLINQGEQTEGICQRTKVLFNNIFHETAEHFSKEK